MYKALNVVSNELFAIKQVKHSIFDENPRLREFTVNEIKSLTQINNPHIVKFCEMLKTSNNIYFVYEYCNGSKLSFIFFKNKKVLKIV